MGKYGNLTIEETAKVEKLADAIYNILHTDDTSLPNDETGTQIRMQHKYHCLNVAQDFMKKYRRLIKHK